jgi:hypothetical protein
MIPDLNGDFERNPQLKPQAKRKMPTSNLVSITVDQTQHDQQKDKTKHSTL